MRIIKGHVEEKKKTAFGILVLLLVLLGTVYRAEFNVSISAEIFRTCFWVALALGAALIVHTVGLEKAAQNHPLATGLCLLVGVFLAWVLLRAPQSTQSDILLPLGFTIVLGVFSYCNTERGLWRYTVSLLLNATALTGLLLFLAPRTVYLFFPSMSLVLFTRLHESLIFCRPLKRKIYALSAGWVLLLLCIVAIILSREDKIGLTALLAPMSDPKGAGFIPITIQNFLSDIRAFGPTHNSEAMEFAASLAPKGNYVLLILAIKFGWATMAAIVILYLAFLVSCFVLLCGKSGLDRTLTCVIPAVGGAIGIFAFLNALGHGIFLAPPPFFFNAAGTIVMLFLCFRTLLSPNEKDAFVKYLEKNEDDASPSPVKLTILDAPSGAGKTWILKKMIQNVSDYMHYYTGAYLTSEAVTEAILKSCIQDEGFDPEAVVEWMLQGKSKVKLVVMDDIDICLNGRMTTQKRVADIIIYLLNDLGIDVAIAGIGLKRSVPALMRILNKYCRKNKWVKVEKCTDISLLSLKN